MRIVSDSNLASPAPESPAISPLDQLRLLLNRAHLPYEGLDRFLEFVKRAVDDLGPSDAELLKLVFPYREHITGNDKLGALRHNLEEVRTRHADLGDSAAEDPGES
jgi:hypothetical protein